MNTQSFSLAFAPQIESEIDQGIQTPRRFTGVAYSGGLIPGHGFLGDVAIDLSTLKVPTKPLFALLNHDPDQRVGKLTLTNQATRLTVDGSFSQATTAGQQVSAECAEGAPWEFSVGIQATPEFFDEPKEVEVNGQILTVNTLLSNARVHEVSFVPAGADPNTQAIAFAKHSEVSEFHEDVKMSDELKNKLDSVNQLNVDLNIKLAAMQTEHAKIVSELEAKVAQEHQLSVAFQQEAQQIKDELLHMQQAIRLSAIKALFSELDREFTDESAKPYLEMSDELFAVVSADLCALKQPNVKSNYFEETAVNGKSGDKTNVDFAAQLFKQVAGVK